MSALSIDDLHALRTIVVVAMNGRRAEAWAEAGADFLGALRVDGNRAQPQLGEVARRALARVDEIAALYDRLGAVLDAELVAADPDRTRYPAAHARARDRMAKAAVAS